MEISKKVLEKNHEQQQKEREAKNERFNDLIEKLNIWFVDQGLTLADVVTILQILDRTLQQSMQSKTLPIVQEWNGKPFADLIAKPAQDTEAVTA